MSDEWGPWIDGAIAPPVGAYVQMEVRNKKGLGDLTHEAVVLGLIGDDLDISPLLPFGSAWELDRYRIRKPRALLDMIERARELDDAPEGPVRTPAAPKVTA